MTTQPKFLTPKEIANRLSCSRIHVYRLISSGTLQAINISTGSQRTHHRVTESDLDNYIASMALTGAGKG